MTQMCYGQMRPKWNVLAIHTIDMFGVLLPVKKESNQMCYNKL